MKMPKSDGNPVAQALNRLADAQFQNAKCLARHNKLIERQVACSEAMVEMQRVNLRVSQHLEAELAAKTAAERSQAAN